MATSTLPVAFSWSSAAARLCLVILLDVSPLLNSPPSQQPTSPSDRRTDHMAWAFSTYPKAAALALGVVMLLSPSTALTSEGDFNYTSKNQEASIANGVQVPIQPSTCYSPFHNKEYPLLNDMTLGDLTSAMDEDFSIMANYFSTVRTYYSSYYGIPVTPIAAKYGMKLYLGVYMTEESWYSGMVDAAVQAVMDHPETISAILVGNENIKPAGTYSPADVKQRISDLRDTIKTKTGRTDIPIGTVQRSTEWLDASIQTEMQELAKACDIIGVNIYPFFDKNFNADSPALLLDGTWNAMMNLYDSSKLRVTETGWPTAGTPVAVAPNNKPSLANSKLYYDAFTQWQPAAGGGEAFWFMFFDRAPYDTTMGADIETYFGFYTWEKKAKMTSGYPDLLSEGATITPATTTAAPAVTTATPTATPGATTAAPAATTATPAATTATPAATTATPVATTTIPASTTAAPASTTAAPVVTTATPTTAPTTTPSSAPAGTSQRCGVRKD